MPHRLITKIWFFIIAVCPCAWSVCAEPLPQETTQKTSAPQDFAHTIAPLLMKHCAECHAGDQKSGGLSLNTRELMLEGGENGAVVDLASPTTSRLLEVVTSDGDDRMPPEGPGLSADEVARLRTWLLSGAPWDDGMQLKQPAYDPPLLPRRPDLPPATQGRTHAIDRLLDAERTKQALPLLAPADDNTFARRVSLDLVGLLPTDEQLNEFLNDRAADRRDRYISRLLSSDIAYAEHWLTFWNDLLRNDYGGTGFITGGRKQVSKWLYESLVTNRPYHQMAKELIAPPTDESRGFIDGIRWRGEVSAGQTVEIQFAQSVAQSFLGINMKCASCHDSFIDRWKLEEAYGLAAIYASKALEIHRCDKPIGRQASPSWLFPELGQIDANAAPAERLKQLADLMTNPNNGRFTRTIVNRLWQRMMGRGIVHPLDAMQTPPWNEDLLDYLAVDFAEHHYDLKHTLKLIATSHAYQSVAETVRANGEETKYVYSGPRAKRLTAEQFVDAVWQLTGAAPTKFDAPVTRSKPLEPNGLKSETPLVNRWIWGHSAQPGPSPAGETLWFRYEFLVPHKLKAAAAILTCDNEFTLYINGAEVSKDEAWDSIEAVPLMNYLQPGRNAIDIVGRNAGSGPNAAGLYFEGRLTAADGKVQTIVTGEDWQYSPKAPVAKDGRLVSTEMPDARSAIVVPVIEPWAKAVDQTGLNLLMQTPSDGRMVRSGLLKSDFLTRSLGRPNRDQIVSMRPDELSTLEAIDLANGEMLAKWLTAGAQRLARSHKGDTQSLVTLIYRQALSRNPTAQELGVIQESMGNQLTPVAIEDLLWSIIMLPEFQLVR